MAGGATDEDDIQTAKSLFTQAKGVAPTQQAQQNVVAAYRPSSVYTAGQAPNAQPTSASQPYTVSSGFNPYSTPGTTTAPTVQPQTLNLPGVQGAQNPFYSAPKVGSTTPNTAASNLSSQYNTYRQGYATQLADAQAKMRADALAAQAEYQKQKAIEDAKYNDMVSKLNQGYRWVNGNLVSPDQYAQQYGWYGSGGGGGGGDSAGGDGGGSGDGGAAGGDVSNSGIATLMRKHKR